MRVHRILSCIVAAAIGSTRLAATEFRTLPVNPTPAQACRNLAQANVGWTDPVMADQERSAQAHARLRSGHGPAIPEDGRIIRIMISGGMGNFGPVPPESIIAWQSPDRQWQVSRVFQSNGPPAGLEFPYPPKWPEPAGAVEREGIYPPPDDRWEVEDGTLSAGDAAKLEALLAAPCMKREPAEMPRDLPVRRGDVEYCVPDSTYTSVEIREGGASRLYQRPCRLLGPVGAIVGVVSKAPRQSTTVRFRRAELYTQDGAATVDGMHQFLAHRLPGAQWQAQDLPGRVTVESYRRLGPCTGEFSGRTEDGTAVKFTRDWSQSRSTEYWPDGATARFYFDKDEKKVERVTMSGTVAALKLDGAKAWISSFCKSAD